MKRTLSTQDQKDVWSGRSRIQESNIKVVSKKPREGNKGYVETSAKKKRFEDWNPENSAKPSGKLIKCTGKGQWKRKHYEQFERLGKKYALEDAVLLSPEDESKEKPYIAIIKDIYEQGKKGYVKLEVQWLYRPDDTNKKDDETWKLTAIRDIFYSFHRDDNIPAESVVHKCTVNFLPPNKQLPKPKQHRGFIVQSIYDVTTTNFLKLNDENFTKKQKQEINLLMQNTMSKLGDLPDVDVDVDSKEEEDCEFDHLFIDALLQLSVRKPVKEFDDKQDNKFTRFIRNVECYLAENEPEKKTIKLKGKRSGRKRMFIKHVDVVKEKEMSLRTDYKSILDKFGSLTGDSIRDKGLEKLLKGVEYKLLMNERNQTCSVTCVWPDGAVKVVCALEQVLYDNVAFDLEKYKVNLGMLVHNLKCWPKIVEQLLNEELKPEEIFSMSSYELQKSFTSDELN